MEENLRAAGSRILSRQPTPKNMGIALTTLQPPWASSRESSAEAQAERNSASPVGAVPAANNTCAPTEAPPPLGQAWSSTSSSTLLAARTISGALQAAEIETEIEGEIARDASVRRACDFRPEESLLASVEASRDAAVVLGEGDGGGGAVATPTPTPNPTTDGVPRPPTVAVGDGDALEYMLSPPASAIEDSPLHYADLKTFEAHQQTAAARRILELAEGKQPTTLLERLARVRRGTRHGFANGGQRSSYASERGSDYGSDRATDRATDRSTVNEERSCASRLSSASAASMESARDLVGEIEAGPARGWTDRDRSSLLGVAATSSEYESYQFEEDESRSAPRATLCPILPS